MGSSSSCHRVLVGRALSRVPPLAYWFRWRIPKWLLLVPVLTSSLRMHKWPPPLTHSLGSDPHGSCLFGRHFKIISVSPSPTVCVLFNLVFCTGLGVQSACEPFKSRFSLPCISVVFLGIFSVGFRSQMF